MYLSRAVNLLVVFLVAAKVGTATAIPTGSAPPAPPPAPPPPPTPCAPGSYSTNGLDYLGAGACKPCAAGTYSASSGATNCSPCPSGTWSPVGSSSVSDCARMPAGGSYYGWNQLPFRGHVPARVDNHAVAVLGSQIIVFGGWSDCSSSMDRNCAGIVFFAINATDGWCENLEHASGTPPTARKWMGFTAEAGAAFVMGGRQWQGPGSADLDDLHAFDLRTKTWQELNSASGVTGTPPAGREGLAMTAHNGSLWVTFGTYGSTKKRDDAHRYDIAAKKWTAIRSSSVSRSHHSQAMLGSLVLTFGGVGGGVTGYSADYLNDIMTLDLEDEAAAWTTLDVQGDIPQARTGASMAAVGSKLVLFGGQRDYGPSDRALNDLYILRLSSNASNGVWIQVDAPGEAPPGRSDTGYVTHGAAVVGCSFFFFDPPSTLFWYEVAPESGEDDKCQPGGALPAAASPVPEMQTTTPPPSPVIPTPPPTHTPAPAPRSKDWGKAEYDRCAQALSWAELVQGDKTGTVTFKMGGLGVLMEERGYETWQCIRDHFCAADAANPWFCFVYHETDKVFTPWGHNSQLQLVAPAPCDCKCGCD